MADAYGQTYQTCGASATTVLGAPGRIGDVLKRVVVVPSNVAVGTAQIKDGSAAAINIVVAGNLVDLAPIVVDFGDGIRCTGAGWSVILGANMTAIAVGSWQ